MLACQAMRMYKQVKTSCRVYTHLSQLQRMGTERVKGVLRQKGVGETKEYPPGWYACHKGKNGVGLHRGDVDEHDATCSDVNGERSNEGLGSSLINGTGLLCRQLQRSAVNAACKHLHLIRLARLEFKSAAYNTLQTYLKRGLQIGPMRRHTLHFLLLVSHLVFVKSHSVFFPYLPPSLSWSNYF